MGTLSGSINGMTYAPTGKPQPVCQPGEFMFAAMALDHGHIYGQTNGLREAGGICKWVYDHDPARVANFLKTYPEASELLITADGGGSNGSRTRLWKVALQRLADTTGLKIVVCHFPPGTSKWNKIEHRMFCHITRNWRGRPLESLEVVVNLIASTTTTKGLRIRAALDTDTYPTGIKVDDAAMATLHLTPDTFHGDWNYAITPADPGSVGRRPRRMPGKLTK